MNVNAPAGGILDLFKWRPWRAPGSAPMLDPCGMAGGSPSNNDPNGGIAEPPHLQGDRGSDLPASEDAPVWKRGSTVNITWVIAANRK